MDHTKEKSLADKKVFRTEDFDRLKELFINKLLSVHTRGDGTVWMVMDPATPKSLFETATAKDEVKSDYGSIFDKAKEAEEDRALAERIKEAAKKTPAAIERIQPYDGGGPCCRPILEVYPVHTRVRFKDSTAEGITGIITQVGIHSSNVVTYQVEWWLGGQIHSHWFHDFEFEPVGPYQMNALGFHAAPSR